MKCTVLLVLTPKAHGDKIHYYLMLQRWNNLTERPGYQVFQKVVQLLFALREEENFLLVYADQFLWPYLFEKHTKIAGLTNNNHVAAFQLCCNNVSGYFCCVSSVFWTDFGQNFEFQVKKELSFPCIPIFENL